MDKVVNQRIVPFVEDHRNLLIIHPVKQLSTESMATVQAALKRGIEMTFQIEESELVAEPLPKLDDRKSLLFYEAAEGGAGVLTRLASEPESLALVASKALEIMHFQKPQGNWNVNELSKLEIKGNSGNALCEAGCYQCLLSYFNQPDHENINRRDRDALELLVALANANVQQSSQATTNAPVKNISTNASIDNIAMEFLNTIEKQGINKPDAIMVPVSGGSAIAVAQYKSARALVFTKWPSDEIVQQLTDKGWACINASNSAEWERLFSEHVMLFHPVGSKEI